MYEDFLWLGFGVVCLVSFGWFWCCVGKLFFWCVCCGLEVFGEVWVFLGLGVVFVIFVFCFDVCVVGWMYWCVVCV